MKNVHWWIAVGLVGMLAGCGQKGPLVLPDTHKHKKSVPSPRAPAIPRPASPVPPAEGAPAASQSPGAPASDSTGNPSNAPQP